MQDKTKSYWHWITALMVLLMMFTCTMGSSGFSVLVNGMKKTAGLTGVQSSLIFTIKNLSCLLFVFVADQYYKKVGLRLGVFGGFLLGALSMFIYMLNSVNVNIIMLYIASVILGATYAFCMLLPMALIIKAWFNKSRAFAMSIGSAGTGINAMIVTPYLQKLIISEGLSAAFRFVIGMFIVVGIIFVLVVRSTPEERGLEPYGGYDYAVAAKKTGSGIVVNKKWIPWFMLCASLLGFAAGPTQQYFILHFNHIGYDSMLVAKAYGVIGVLLVIFKLSFGTLSTKFNFGKVCAVFLFFYVLSCCFAAGSQFIKNPTLVFAATSCLGVAGAVTSLGYPNWIADCHPEDYAKTVKNTQSCYQGIEVLGSFVPGLILDWTGQYTAFYMLNACLYAIVLFIVLTAYVSSSKEQAA